MSRHYYPAGEQSANLRASARPSPISPPLMAILQNTASNLKELEERINLHSVFRQQRIKALGWFQQPPEATIPSSQSDQLSNNESKVASKDDDSKAKSLLREYDEMKEQFLQILQSAETRAYIHLMHRLSFISQNLQQNVVLWLADR